MLSARISFPMVLLASLFSGFHASAQLVSYWPLNGNLLDGATAGRRVDIGKAVAQETYSEGVHGLGLDLDGTSPILFSPSEDLSLMGNVSMALWFRVSDQTNAQQALISGTPFRLQREAESGALELIGETSTAIGGDATDQEWHHVIAVSEAGWGTRLYLDGRLVGVGEDPIEAASTEMALGADPNKPGLEWQGQLDDVGVFESALNEYQANAIFELARDPQFDYSLYQASLLLEAHGNQESVIIEGTGWQFVERVKRGNKNSLRLANDRSGMEISLKPNITSFMASKTLPRAGEEVSLSWTSVNATSLTLYPGKIDLSESLPNGSVRISPEKVTLYTLMAESAHGGDLAQVSIYAGVEGTKLQLTEWMAAPAGEQPDENGNKPDWIELQNPGHWPMSTGGYYLTDDPDNLRKWALPDTRLPAQKRKIVFASGEPSPHTWHANFKLDEDGEFLALTYADEEGNMSTVEAINYPKQQRGVSYGQSQDHSTMGFLPAPTPGKFNKGTTLKALTSRVYFSQKRGLKDTPFSLELDCATPEARILYSQDGSVPTSETGSIYDGPISISSTSVVRAIAHRPFHVPSEVTSHTYLFPKTISQQGAIHPGWPKSWGGVDGDYEVDPEVVLSAEGVIDFTEGLRSLPVVSIALDPEDAFGPNGIYSQSEDSGREWERRASMEMMFPDKQSFQIDCGLRMHGGSGRNRQNLKHSFRLLFKKDYGPTKLEEAVFPEANATQRFDTLILRAGHNHTWHIHNLTQNSQAQYLRDEFIRTTQREMGHASAHGTYVHVMLNGLYWGLYNLAERPSAAFAAAYLGGKKEDWDASNSGKVIDGTSESWEQIKKVIRLGMQDEEAFEIVQQWINLPNLIDYLILNFYVGNSDWDSHNWYAARRRAPGEGVNFFSWDAECSLQHLRMDLIPTIDRPQSPSLTPTGLHSALAKNADYRMTFADRIHKHLTGSGALTPQRSTDRYRRLAKRIEPAIVCESARWGDAWTDEPYTIQDWRVERDRLLESYLPRRTAVVLRQFIKHGLYPALSPPSLQRIGDTRNISLVANEGEIWYTTDRTDPRLPGGEINPNAQSGTSTELQPGHKLSARCYHSGTWSALSELSYE